VFSRSFVRQYARFLDLDEPRIAEQLEQILDPLPEVPELLEPSKSSAPLAIQLPAVENWQTVGGDFRPTGRSPLVSLGLVVVAILGCAGIYAWWTRPHHSSPVEIADEAPAVQPAQRTAPAPAQAAAPPPAQITPAAQTEDTSNAAVRVEMTAAEPVWVSAKSEGHSLFEGVLETNQSRTFDSNTAVTLIIGNAGGVSIVLNGKPIGSVGSKGQVRNVQLTSGGFEIVPPKAASLEPM
jgi:cytoskeletal protein RodZ